MAIALSLDPVWVTGTATSIASAAFSPVANSLIIVESHIDAATTPTISDSVGLTWTAIGTPQSASLGGRAAAWWAFTASARTNMTVTVGWSSGATKSIKVKTWTGTASASAVISKAQNTATTTPLNLGVTTTNDGCRISGSALDWNARGGPTSSDDEVSFTVAGAISGTSVHKAANSTGVGTSVTLNIVKGTVAPQGADWAYKVWEIVPAAGGATDLTVADASQPHTVDNVVLTQTHVLTVDAATQTQTADSISIAVDLIVADAVQAQSTDSIPLDGGVVPWVRDARQGGTGGTNTAINHSVPTPLCNVGDDLFASFTLNGGHGTVTEPSGWTRVFPASITDDGFMTLLIYRKTATATEAAGGSIALSVGTAVRGNYGSIAIVGSDPALAPDGVVEQTGTSGATSVSPVLTSSAGRSLSLSILALDSASENATPSSPLIQRWDPAESGVIGQANVGATVHTPTAGTATLTWTWTNTVARKCWTASIRSEAAINLTVADAGQSHTVDNVTLSVGGGGVALVPADATQAHTADNVTIAVDLIVASGTQAHTADNVSIAVNLIVASGTQAHTADNVTLAVDLIVASGTQAHTADNVTLAVDLIVASGTQAHTADNVTLAGGNSLTVADASQPHTVDNVVLTQVHNLTVAGGTQAHTADNVTITQAHSLAVAGATQAHTADNVTVSFTVALTVQSATHGHTATSPTLTQLTLLAGSMKPADRATASATGRAIPATAPAMTPDRAAASATGRAIPATAPAMTPTVHSGTTMTGG